MVRRLPSLNQLRAFEAAARHESIKEGAAELCVTAAAVGHQIKALEATLNVSLFQRQTRQIVLTQDGRKLAERVGQALDILENAVLESRKPDPDGQLKITIAPFFGNRWLLPRLREFHELYPGIKVIPHLSFEYVDVATSGFDAALRFGSGNWQGLSATLIFRDRVGPVCAPQLLGNRTTPLSVDAVLALPLACSQDWRSDWAAWGEAGGSRLDPDMQLQEFESRAFMFDAALSGQAVILADRRMTAADEAAGRLVRLNPLTVERPQGVYIAADRRSSNACLDLFSDWLKSEADASGE